MGGDFPFPFSGFGFPGVSGFGVIFSGSRNPKPETGPRCRLATRLRQKHAHEPREVAPPFRFPFSGFGVVSGFRGSGFRGSRFGFRGGFKDSGFGHPKSDARNPKRGHLADWPHDSYKNMRMIYGRSAKIDTRNSFSKLLPDSLTQNSRPILSSETSSPNSETRNPKPHISKPLRPKACKSETRNPCTF